MFFIGQNNYIVWYILFTGTPMCPMDCESMYQYLYVIGQVFNYETKTNSLAEHRIKEHSPALNKTLIKMTYQSFHPLPRDHHCLPQHWFLKSISHQFIGSYKLQEQVKVNKVKIIRNSKACLKKKCENFQNKLGSTPVSNSIFHVHFGLSYDKNNFSSGLLYPQ